MILRLLLRHKPKARPLNYCTKSDYKNKLYSNTIFLPKTKFPLRLENKKLVERDERIASVAKFDLLYKWQRSYLSEPEFVLHDGPPYANGKLHMGHALNKILKDTILRYEILKGHKINYVPGWDCHGLPIELKALTIHNSEPMEIRTKARNFAKNTINEQKQVFKSWGVLGDWEHHYATYSPDYVKTQLKIFYKLYEKNLIYRDVKPIYWSPSSKTALAEAELEYNENHKSPSVYARFKIKNIPNKANEEVYALIWTTTPWTLPANQAICYNPSLPYALVKNSKDNKTYLLATDTIKTLEKTLNCNFKILDNLIGEMLSQWTYLHPIFGDRELRFLPGAHATTAKGTGLVHTAPAHGPEDFLVALTEKITIDNLVDELGCYNRDAGKELEGKFVLSEGNNKVLDLIKDNVVHFHEHQHSYPYDWRTKKPIIIRASLQWFLDTDSIKTRAIDLLEHVKIIPKINSETYKRNLISQIEKRPYWCISRQRQWGVPIPVFFNKSNNKILISEDLIRHLCQLIDLNGTDFWWKLPLAQLIPEEMRHGVAIDQIEKGQDILDIWFDSGISWAKALEGDKTANMYLEGVDQFTGWFQSSLLTSVALRDKCPYKTIYVHGFVVDANGNKMSKSLGNVVDPLEITRGSERAKPYGIDTLRWWVACHANQDSLAHISANVLQACSDELQKIRSILRFVLGSLEDYHEAPLDLQNQSVLDKYMLHLLHQFYHQTQDDINNYQFQRICKNVINLLTNPVSALYYTGIKDRLYCDMINDASRRASQFVLLQIFEIVTQAIAPIVPHLVEEMFLYLPQKNGKSYFTSTHSEPEKSWENLQVEKVMDVILTIKKVINKEVGAATLDSVVDIIISPNFRRLIQEIAVLNEIETELEDILQVSRVNISENDINTNFQMKITKSVLYSCPRCRRIKSQSDNELCDRCTHVINNSSAKTVATN